jgi:hypothetical protein
MLLMMSQLLIKKEKEKRAMDTCVLGFVERIAICLVVNELRVVPWTPRLSELLLNLELSVMSNQHRKSKYLLIVET